MCSASLLQKFQLQGHVYSEWQFFLCFLWPFLFLHFTLKQLLVSRYGIGFSSKGTTQCYRNHHSYFKPVLKHYRSQYSSISFESEAEKIPSEIRKKKSFIAKKRKSIDKKDENIVGLKKNPETHIKKHRERKKLMRNTVPNKQVQFRENINFQ